MRQVFTNGTIVEATWTNLKLHGLSRKIELDQVTVQLWQRGIKVSELIFDANFVETSRSNSNELFGRLYGYQFASERNDTLMVERML